MLPIALVSGLIPPSAPPVAGSAQAIPEVASLARADGREVPAEGFSSLLEREIGNFNKESQHNENKEQNITTSSVELAWASPPAALDVEPPIALDPPPPVLPGEPSDQPVTVLPLALAGVPLDSTVRDHESLPGNVLPHGRQEPLPVPPPAHEAGLAARVPRDGGWALALGSANRGQQADARVSAAHAILAPGVPDASDLTAQGTPVQVPPSQSPRANALDPSAGTTNPSEHGRVPAQRLVTVPTSLPAGHALVAESAPGPDPGTQATAQSDTVRSGAAPVAWQVVQTADSGSAFEVARETVVERSSRSGVPEGAALAPLVRLPGTVASGTSDADGNPPALNPVTLNPHISPGGADTPQARSLASDFSPPRPAPPGLAEAAGGGFTPGRAPAVEPQVSPSAPMPEQTQVAGSRALLAAETPERIPGAGAIPPSVSFTGPPPQQSLATADVGHGVPMDGPIAGPTAGLATMIARTPGAMGDPVPEPGAPATEGRSPVAGPVATVTGMPSHRAGARHGDLERVDGTRTATPGPVVTLTTSAGDEELSAGPGLQNRAPNPSHAVRFNQDGAPPTVVGPAFGQGTATLSSEDPLLRAPADGGSDGRALQALAALDVAAAEVRSSATLQTSAGASPAGGGGRTELPALATAPLFAGPVLPFQATPGPGFGEDLGHRILWLSGNRLRSAEIQLDPPELGPLQVQVHAHREGASVQFIAHSAAARDAVEASLPKLREMLEASGLNLLDVNVAQQQERGGRDSAQTPRDAGRGSLIDVEAVTRLAPSADRVRVGLVDDYA